MISQDPNSLIHRKMSSFLLLVVVPLAGFSFSIGCDSQILDESLGESQKEKTPSGWTRIDQLTGGRVRAIYVNGLDVYLGTDASGITFSDDGGDNWRSINAGLNDIDKSGEPSLGRKRIRAFARLGETVFAGVETGAWVSGYNTDYVGGVFALLSEKEDWQCIGLKEKQVSSLAVIDHNLVVGTNSGVYLLTRIDDAWNVEHIGLKDLDVSSLAVIDRWLFASARNEIHRTDDFGKNWTNVNDKWSDYIRVSTLLAVGSVLVAGTGHGVLFSEDNGANWIEKTDGIPRNRAGLPSIRSMVQANSLLLASASSDCVIYDPGGTTCTKSGLLLSHIQDTSWEFIEFEGLDPVPVAVVEDKILVGIPRTGMYGSKTNEVWMNTTILNSR